MIGKTTREVILVALQDVLENTSVSVVNRGRFGGVQKEFVALPETSFPLVIMDAGLPQPEIKYSTRQQGVIDEVRSVLNVEVFVFMRFAEGLCGNEDEKVSALLLDVWKHICNKPNVGNAIQIQPSFSPKITYVDNYCYFTMSLNIVYLHDKDTI